MGVLLQQVCSFKYLGSELMTEGGINAAVKQRVQTAWNKWSEITGVICDRKIPRKLKYKTYKCYVQNVQMIRPVLLYGAECWAVGKKEKEFMNRAEMRMLRWILGVSQREEEE